MARPLRQSIRAFTIIELVLVVATVAVLSAIAVPRYSSSMTRYRADMAAKRVVADLAMARAAARASGTGLTINFSTSNSTYTLVGVAASDGQSGNYTVRLGDEPYKAKLTSVVFGTATPAATSVNFTRFGTPELDGALVVSCGVHSKTIVIDSITGRAEVR